MAEAIRCRRGLLISWRIYSDSVRKIDPLESTGNRFLNSMRTPCRDIIKSLLVNFGRQLLSGLFGRAQGRPEFADLAVIGKLFAFRHRPGKIIIIILFHLVKIFLRHIADDYPSAFFNQRVEFSTGPEIVNRDMEVINKNNLSCVWIKAFLLPKLFNIIAQRGIALTPGQIFGAVQIHRRHAGFFQFRGQLVINTIALVNDLAQEHQIVFLFCDRLHDQRYCLFMILLRLLSLDFPMMQNTARARVIFTSRRLTLGLINISGFIDKNRA